MRIESIAWHKLRTSRHSKVLPGRKIYCGEFLRKVLWAIDAPGASPCLTLVLGPTFEASLAQVQGGQRHTLKLFDVPYRGKKCVNK